MKALYQFSASDSFMHSLDPRSKLLFLICFLIPLWTFPMPIPAYFAIALIFVIWAGARISPFQYGFFVVLMIPIMVAIVLIQVLAGGSPYSYLTINGVSIFRYSVTGLEVGLRVAFRLLAMGIAFIGFSMTTDPFHWGMSLYKMGLPYKSAFMFGFAMRFFPLLQEELVVINNALKARASDTVGTKNPIKILKAVGMMGIPLGLNSLRRSQHIALAMELRGYSIPEILGVKRNLYRIIKFSWRDLIVALISVALLTSVFFELF